MFIITAPKALIPVKRFVFRLVLHCLAQIVPIRFA